MDITKLEGYNDTLTAEEKLALVQKYEIPAPDTTGLIRKDMFDKTASELAEAKRQLKAKMSEDEQKEAERLANEAAMKAELESLKKDRAISESKAQYLALGYDEKLADETSKALVEGNMAKVFENQKLHIENVKKSVTASALADDPKPSSGVVPGAQAIDFSKQIAEAQANSDFGTAAMLIRQQQESTMKK